MTRQRIFINNFLLLLLAIYLSMGPGMARAANTGSMSSLERFIDGVMERSIVAGESVGATVALVQNGRLVVARGYGLADTTGGVPVESRVTQFRIGSVSKVLVWISVLQLVEAGKLDLDVDVNTYLTDITIPEVFASPITMRHLMTHTPGFEDDLVNLFVSGPRQVGTLAQTLAQSMPSRVRLPGRLVAYSNYGAALAGHIVAQVSGQSFDDYVDAHILEPLGMTGATTRQPLPDAFANSRAKGYTPITDGFSEQGFMYVPLAPAGAGTATALDMARLMVELLNPRGTSILSAASKAQLLGGAYISDPLVNGMTLGMYEMTRGGARAVGHGGNTLLFNSEMVLWPDERMGLFVATNTLGGEGVARALVDTVAARLGFDNGDAALKEVLSADAYVGTYISARRNHSNFTKLMGLSDTARVSYDVAETELLVTDNLGTRRYRQLGEGVFQHVAGADRIVFKGAPQAASELYFSNRPMIGYTRASRAQTPAINGLVVAVWLLLSAGVAFVWPVSALTHRRRNVQPGQRVASFLTYLSVLVMLAFVLQLGAVIDGPYTLLMDGFDAIPQLLWYPALFAVLLIVRLFYFYRVWAGGFWWPSRRLHFTCVLLADSVLLWWLWYWNLLPGVVLGFLK